MTSSETRALYFAEGGLTKNKVIFNAQKLTPFTIVMLSSKSITHFFQQHLKTSIKLNRNMFNKRGIELSVNFLVVVILSIAILSFGIKFAYDLLNSAEKIKQNEFNKIDSELDNLVCENQNVVCVTTPRKKIGSSRSAYFGVKVWNIGGLTPNSFKMEINPSGTCLIKNDDSTETNCGSYIKSITDYKTGFEISEKGYVKKIVGVELTPTTISGTYIFNLQVKNDINNYGPIQKLYVEVP